MSPSTVNFDKYAFKKYMKNIGRAYQKQAMELISACRLFVQAQEQSYQSDIELRSALSAVDNALRCAAEAKGKTSKEADKCFKDATELLGNYERKYCFKDQDSAKYEKQDKTFLKRMEEATSKDKSSSTILSKLKETFHSITHDEPQEPTRVVEFRLCKSPTDGDPIVVHQTLCESSNLQEILWNFSRYKGKKRLTLKENPHFYEHLPCSPEAYGNTFKANAIQDFQHVEKIYVLTDKVGRVYVETQAQYIRTFGNVWVPSHVIIFKDIYGMLEGERHVERSIDTTPKIWYRKEHPLPPLPTPVNSTSVVTIPVWKEVIRLTVDDRYIDIDIYISTRPPELEDGWILYPPSSPPSSRPPQQAPKRLLYSPQAQPAPQELPTSVPSQAVRAHTSRTARRPLRQRASERHFSLASHAPQEPPRAPLQDVPAHTSEKAFKPPQLHRSERQPSITSPKFHELPTPAPNRARPTSNSPYSPISMLNDDALLNIFKVYRLYRLRVDHDDDVYRQSPRWAHPCWWYKLVHVSRQWRRVILSSSVQLDIHLLCTNGVPVADMLAHSLPLPLTVVYRNAYREMTTEDEEGALLALSLRHRVRRIALLMPNPNLGKFMTAIDDEFPILERMWIRSQSKDSTELVFPQAGKFQAPNLRHIWTTSIGFPPLTYTAGLVHLKLIDIPAAAYLPPSYILPRILLMRQLETLMIHFRSPPPNGVVEKQALNTPITPHPLLHLHLLSFRGVSDYLEGIITQISAPVLSTLDIHFFHQAIPFNISCLRQFTKNLIFSDVELNFKGGAVTLVAGPGRSRPLCVEVMCRRLDWQVSCAVEILGSFSPILSAVEKLALRHVELSESPNEVNRTQWRELFKPFNNVKTLLVPSTLARGLAHSLCSKAGESPMELLPNLLELRCPGGSVIAFYSFIFARKVAGHPVRLI